MTDFTPVSERRRAHDEALIAAIVEAVIGQVGKHPTPHCLTEEEQHWVRLAIIKQEQSIKLRQAIIEKSLAGLVWSGIVGLGFIFLDFLKSHGFK